VYLIKALGDNFMSLQLGSMATFALNQAGITPNDIRNLGPLNQPGQPNDLNTTNATVRHLGDRGTEVTVYSGPNGEVEGIIFKADVTGPDGNLDGVNDTVMLHFGGHEPDNTRPLFRLFQDRSTNLNGFPANYSFVNYSLSFGDGSTANHVGIPQSWELYADYTNDRNISEREIFPD
jgi:hypothetical protein